MTGCRHITEAEALKLAKLAAEKLGIDRSDVRDVDISDYDCSIHFEEKNLLGPDTRYRLVNEDSKWRLERKVNFLFGGFDFVFSCGADVAGSGSYEDVGVTLPDAGGDNGATGKDNARIDNSSSCNDTDGGIVSQIAGTVSYLKDGNWDSTADACKTPEILLEKSCAGYIGDKTTETLLTTFIFCHCEKDRCVDEPLDLCNDPLPDEPPVGGTVWEWGTGNVVLDFCADETSVRHITCDADGAEKQDITPCPEDSTCMNGLCGDMGCFDDDPEKDIYVKGHLKLKILDTEYTEEDYCSSSDTVVQFTCPPNTSDFFTSSDIYKYQDNYDCAEGYVCDDGICVPESDSSQQICKDKYQCLDSDPENDPFTQGVITYVCEEPPFTIKHGTDSCLDNNSMDETYYKDNNGLVPKPILVQFDCEQPEEFHFSECPSDTYCVAIGDIKGGGFCVNLDDEKCFDGDFGINPEINEGAGIYNPSGPNTYVPINSSDDFCMTSEPNTLIEIYCGGESGPLMYEKIPCPPNSFCIEGACRMCTDEDPDDDPKKLGYVVDAYGTNESDYCVGDKVVQVFCNDEGKVDASEPIPCAGGGCEKGVCK